MDIAGWNQRFLNDRDQPLGPPANLVRTTVPALPPGAGIGSRRRIGPQRDLAGATGLAGDCGRRRAGGPRHAARARRLACRLRTIQADIEAHEYTIAPNAWDLIVIAYYLQRDLIEPAKQGVKPGGTLLIIVHITAAGEEPTAHRLRPGELRRLYFSGEDGWEVLHDYEGYPHDPSHRRGVAEIVARKPG